MGECNPTCLVLCFYLWQSCTTLLQWLNDTPPRKLSSKASQQVYSCRNPRVCPKTILVVIVVGVCTYNVLLISLINVSLLLEWREEHHFRASFFCLSSGESRWRGMLSVPDKWAYNCSQQLSARAPRAAASSRRSEMNLCSLKTKETMRRKMTRWWSRALSCCCPTSSGMRNGAEQKKYHLLRVVACAGRWMLPGVKYVLLWQIVVLRSFE